MNNIIIFGGAGYIGSSLIEHLLKDNKVTCVDNLFHQNEYSLLPYLKNNNFEFVFGDIRDPNCVKDNIKDKDIIVNLSALVGKDICDRYPIDAEMINFGGCQNIINYKSNNQYLLYPNTNSGYSMTDGKSLITEKDPLTPNSIYGKTKCRAEDLIKNKNSTVFRLATVFSVSNRPRRDLLVNNLVYRAIKDRVLIIYEGGYQRNYLHIQDACRAFVHAIENYDKCKNEIFNIGNDSLNMTKLQLCQKVNEFIPVEIIQAEYTMDPDKRNYQVSSNKFYKTGFKCLYTLDDGIRELIKMYNLIDRPQYGNY